MKVGNVLSTAAFLTGNADLSAKIIAQLKGEEVLSGEELKEIEKLIGYYNVTISELSDEYFPLLTGEELKSSDGKFYYDKLKKVPLEIKSVSSGNAPVSFEVYPTYFTAEKNDVYVTYAYKYENKTDVSQECEYTDTVVSERIIAEGVVSEWLMNDGMFEEAVMWRDRYVNSLKNCLIKRKVGKIKPRGWY